MGIHNFWPFSFFILVLGIILLYILKQKAKKREVSSLFLWREVLQNVRATTPFEKFKNQLIMYLQIAFVIFAIVALIGPFVHTSKVTSQLVLVIDQTASMGAVGKSGTNRLEDAKEQAIQMVNSMEDESQITVITLTKDASILMTAKNNKASVRSAIKGLEVTDYGSDMSKAVTTIQSVMENSKKSKCVIYTDTSFSLGKVEAQIVDESSDEENVSITGISYAKEENTNMVLVTVCNEGKKKTVSEVSLYQNNTLLDVASKSVKAGEVEEFYFDVPMAESGYYEAELTQKDALVKDNKAQVAISDKDKIPVLLVSQDNLFLEKAFSAVDGVTLSKTAQLEVDSGYSMYVFDSNVPESIPQSGNLLFFNPPQNSKYAGEVRKKGGYLSFQDTKVSSYLKDTIPVSSYQSLSLPENATPFLLCGEDVVGYYFIDQGQKIVVLGFDIHDTDFALTTGFPVFISNICDYLGDISFVNVDSVEPGENIYVYPKQNEQPIQVTDPSGDRKSLAIEDFNGEFADTAQVGIYEFSQKQENDQITGYGVVRFPISESCLKKAKYEENLVTKQEKQNYLGEKNIAGYFILLVILFFLLEWIWDVRCGRKQRIVLRVITLTLLIAAFANVHFSLKSHNTGTVFLVDVSDSVKNQFDSEKTFIQDAIKEKSKTDYVGVVAFGQDAQVEQFLSENTSFSEVESQLETSATNLEQAISKALSMFTQSTKKRIVIVTDEMVNEGTALNTVTSLADTQVEVYTLDGLSGEEAAIDDVKLPSEVSMGDTYELKVTLHSNVDNQTKILVYQGNRLVKEESILLNKGITNYSITDIASSEGLFPYRVVIEPQKDTIEENNQFKAYTKAEKPTKVLLVASKEENMQGFDDLLTTANIDYQQITPGELPTTVQELLPYKTIIFGDVYYDDLPANAGEILKTYVSQYGGGFIAAGGDNSFALGNYRDTPLEEILPVDMDLQGQKEVPKVAMYMAIDHSGSMSDAENGISSLLLAKSAACSAVKSLRESDEVGVLAFDDTYSWLVKPTICLDKESIMNEIGTLADGGGTSIYPAFAEALEKIGKSDAKLKHIILLTDGEDGQTDYKLLLDKANKQGITVSTVAVGESSAKDLLEKIANDGKGRFYYAQAGADLPRIFAQEYYLFTKDYLVEKDFTPVITAQNEMIDDVVKDGLPQMRGYVAANKKQTATQLLESEDGDPILTTWQYGLGRTIAWNTDITYQWTSEYSSFEPYVELWKNMITSTVVDQSLGKDSYDLVTREDGIHITYHADAYSADTELTVVVTGEDGLSQNVKLVQKKPGIYEGVADTKDTSIYGLNITRKEGETVNKIINTAVAVQYNKEYAMSNNTEDMAAFKKAVGAIGVKSPKEVFTKISNQTMESKSLRTVFLVIALLLFMLDVALRRLYTGEWKLYKVIVKNWQERFTHKKRIGMNSSNEESEKEKGEISNIDTKEVAYEEEVIKPPKMPHSMPRKKVMHGQEKVKVQEEKTKGTSEDREKGTTLDTSSLLKKKKNREG